MSPVPPRRVSLHRLAAPVPLLASAPRRKMPPPTKARPLIISASELRDFLRCRVKHHWRHQVQLVPNTGTEALAFGIVVHEILEAWYRLPAAKRTPRSMLRIADARFEQTLPREIGIEQVELIRAMVTGFAEWILPQDREIGLTTCQPETWFEEPLTEDGTIIVRGKIDNVFEPSSFKRTVACSEYKTKGQIKLDVVEMNLQLSVYLWALRKLFPKMKRYIAYYTVLRKQLPGPRVRSELFAREPVERSNDEIAQWAQDTQHAVLDMLDGAIYPNPTDACSWDCDFRIPCLLRGRPDDLAHALKEGYTLKERR